MWSENSDEDIYITQSTFRKESNLDDVSDWFQDGSPTDGQVLNNNVERRKPRQKTALQTQFPRSKFKLRLAMRFLNRQSSKKNGLLTCSRTGDSKEMRK